MRDATVCPAPGPGVKLEEVLTPQEVRQLMEGFLRNKTEVDEDDCITVLVWAREQRVRSLLLGWVLDGSLRPSVVDGEVCLGLPDAAQH
jgi:hypothetical protein